MRSRWIAALVIAFAIGIASDPAFSFENAQKGRDKSQKGQKGQDKKNKSAGDRVREILPESEAVFTRDERVAIGLWYSDDRNGLPPGLAKKDRLPPGLEKQLIRRGTLPPGLQKKVQRLPVGLERELRVLPTGYRRVIVGGNVVLMDRTTSLIYDIVRIAIP